ncbi:MAG: hypothetical protein ACHQAV_04670 [Solirubrobacterales bacterium]
MSRIDDLPPDQNAALSLLLRRRKGYAEVAALLGIEEHAVHDRAHAALAVLAPRQARELTPERREEIGDYLLGQQVSVSERIRTRSFLDGSAPGRAWANALAAELAPLAGASMPGIPEEAHGQAGGHDAHSQAQPPSATDAAHSSAAHAARPLPSSRVGGGLLLAAIVAAVVVAIILIAGGSGSQKHQGSSASAAGSSTGTGSTATTTARAKEDRRITLTAPDPASKSIGVAEVLSEGSKYAFYLAAEHLRASKGFFYAVWLYNSPTSHEALSRSPPVGSDGRLQGGALLPSDAGKYHTMLLTRETSQRPTQPGPTVLSGAFGLH